MSVTRFKVGDKVRVRDGLIGGRYYDGIYCTEDMANLKEVLTVCFAGRNAYKLEGYDLWWSVKMLESAEETLDDLCAGDDISKGCGVRKILAAVDGCFC